MKLMYIDDSFLRSSQFLVTMRKRLFSYCLKHEVAYVLISGTVDESINDVSDFLQLCKENGLTTIKSPAVFEYEDGKGILTHTSLLLDDGNYYYTYSGSALLIDTENTRIDRIYFECFPQAEEVNESKLLEDELVKLLHDAIGKVKKTKHNYH